MRRLQLAQQHGDRLRLGHEAGGQSERRRRRRRPGPQAAQQVADVQDAPDVVDRAAVQRDPRVARLDEELGQLLEIGLRRRTHHVGARSHHAAHHRVAEVDHPQDQVLLARLQDALPRPDVEKGLDLLIRGLVLLLVAALDRRRQQRRHREHQRRQHRQQPAEDQGQPPQHLLRVAADQKTVGELAAKDDQHGRRQGAGQTGRRRALGQRRREIEGGEKAEGRDLREPGEEQPKRLPALGPVVEPAQGAARLVGPVAQPDRARPLHHCRQRGEQERQRGKAAGEDERQRARHYPASSQRARSRPSSRPISPSSLSWS